MLKRHRAALRRLEPGIRCALSVEGEPTIRQAFHLSKSAAQRRLQGLVHAGRLAITGAGRGCRYVVTAPAGGRDPRELAALAIASRDGRVTRRVLALEAGISTRTAGRVLAGLVGEGHLEPDGRGGHAGGYVAA